jgi:hypothetical protein
VFIRDEVSREVACWYLRENIIWRKRTTSAHEDGQFGGNIVYKEKNAAEYQPRVHVDCINETKSRL